MSTADFIKQHDIKFVLAQFVDIHGLPKAKVIPVQHLNAVFEDGAGFAGFAVPGLGMAPHDQDFMAVGDKTTLRRMTWKPGFARLCCDGHVSKKPHPFDPRVILKSAIKALKDETGMQLYTGLEPEFFLLKRHSESGRYEIAVEGDNLQKPCYDYKSMSRAAPYLTELCDALRAADIDVYQIDHEDANGQFEANFVYSDALTTADNFIFFKQAASDIATKHGMIASFMPKIFADRSGSGMHVHMSIGKDGQNHFLDAKDKNGIGLSPLAYHFLGGLLAHAGALTAIGSPTVNSFKRLTGAGSRSGATWAPVYVCYGDNNRTAMVRVPYGRLELRSPDSAANPYLLTAAIIYAGLDGIRRKLNPGSPVNENFYTMSAQELAERKVQILPRDLGAAVAVLKADQVVTQGLGARFVDEFVKLKHEEWDAFNRQVTEWELGRYAELF